MVRYSAAYKDKWDAFIAASRNGTFLLRRDYMDYHSDRFHDHSLMFFHAEELVAVMPAHIAGQSFCSHNGLTYGGLVLSSAATAAMVVDIFNLLRTYLKNNTGVDRIIYRPVPHIYHRYPCEEDLYMLFRAGAVLKERKISSSVWLREPLPVRGRRKITATQRAKLSIVEDGDFDAFWAVLSGRLQERYGAKPVHSLPEIKALHARFSENIKLFSVWNDAGEILGGVVMFVTDRVAHSQYTATTDEGRRIGVLDFLYSYLMRERYACKEYFDFGTSVEDGGRTLNKGLISQKEGFGGRGIVYDTYEIDINSEVYD